MFVWREREKMVAELVFGQKYYIHGLFLRWVAKPVVETTFKVDVKVGGGFACQAWATEVTFLAFGRKNNQGSGLGLAKPEADWRWGSLSRKKGAWRWKRDRRWWERWGGQTILGEVMERELRVNGDERVRINKLNGFKWILGFKSLIYNISGILKFFFLILSCIFI